jgi:hypothetical protein
MPGGRPLNLGLSDALSRIGGFRTPTLPSLLDGVQPVIIYGDVSKSVASEVFEARAMTGVTDATAFGIEISSAAPGGMLIEEIDATLSTGGGVAGASALLALNVSDTSGAVLIQKKLDIGGAPTVGLVRKMTGAFTGSGLQSGALTFDPKILSGTTLIMGVQNRTRIWIQPGAFLQIAPITLFLINSISLHVTWRELADVQGQP